MSRLRRSGPGLRRALRLTLIPALVLLVVVIDRSYGARAAAYLAIAVGAIAGALLVRAARSHALESARQARTLADELRQTNFEVQRAAQRNRRLQEVTAAFVKALMPAQVAAIIVQDGVAASGARFGVLIRAGPRGGADAILAGESCPAAVTRALLSGTGGALTQAAEAREPMWLAGRGAAGEAESEADAWAVLPLSVRDRWLGVLILGYRGVIGFDDDERTFILLLAQQCSQALERARLHAAERRARVHSQFAERQIGFLAAAGSRLSATLDTGRSLADVADLAASNLGEFCAIHVLDGGGRPVLAAGSLAGPAGLVRFGGDESRYPVEAGADIAHARAIRTRQPQLVPVIEHGFWQEAGPADAEARLASLGLTTLAAVPLHARDRLLGALTVASTEPGRSFGAPELALAEQLGERVGQALDAAELLHDALEASRAKSSFLAVMSHELRTPLNAILGYADLMLLGVPAAVAEPTRRHVERIRNAARQLLELVEDVLNYARVEAGRERVRVSAVVFDELVREATGQIRPEAASKGIALGCDADTHAVVHTDGIKLLQILNNLLSNAVKFTQQGSITVTALTEGESVIVAVRDTGMGIPAEHLEHIFDPFWQVEQSPRRRYGGAGIGLGVARHLARLLGGDVTVESTVAEGSCFTLRIPRRYETVAPAGP